ncbi:3'-5' exonuclease [Chryseosolibacter indicus]|uniref:3'-5' exonuclease n=1 Tax=Chryseosolibacter indicus TaxID=2782351 RepID=A0ABS5VMW8_9BACT|nr:3'-5' exonuclease [Chryseosolibacter indicus]MBT1702778.1 3'-5' exonuclease domain-containing protein 2 [Chryseosolibacter indicus]
MDVAPIENEALQSSSDEVRVTITQEEINILPLKTFDGKTSVVSEADKLPKIVKEIEKYDVVGFDTETRPSFKKGQLYQVSLLQLAIPEKVFLIRVNHTGVTDEIAQLFENEKIVKAGVGIRDDLKALQKLRAFEPKNCFDLQTLAKQAGLQVESVKKLSALLLGFRISKGAQTSNWEAPTLTQKQIEYAATDAWVCLELYKKLRHN